MNLTIPASLIEQRTKVMQLRDLLPELKAKHSREAQAYQALTQRLGTDLALRMDGEALGDFNAGVDLTADHEGDAREAYEASRRLSLAYAAVNAARYNLKNAEEAISTGLFDLFLGA